MNTGKLSRRELLRGMAVAGLGVALAACQPAKVTEPPPVKKEVEKEPTQVTGDYLESETAPFGIELTADGRIGHIPLNVWPRRQYDPMITVRQNMVARDSGVYPPGDTQDDNVVTRYIQEMLGIKYEAVWIAGGAAHREKWATQVASGDLPEFLLRCPRHLYGQLLEAGALEDITDIFEASASDLHKRKREFPSGGKWPEGGSGLWKCVRGKDGRFYGIASCAGSPAGLAAQVFWIRKDWLDKLGLPIPDTVQEIYDTAKRFMEEGWAEIGVALQGKDPLITWQFSSDPIFGAFGGMPTLWLEKDGKLSYGSVWPEVKLGLAELRKWYADGIIDPDFINRSTESGVDVIAANKAGIFPSENWAPCCAIKDSKNNDPNAEWVYIDVPPAGPTGLRHRKGGQLLGDRRNNYFKKGTDPEKIEAVIEHYNYDHACADASSLHARFKFEGYDYVMNPDGTAGPSKEAYAGTGPLEPALGDLCFGYPTLGAESLAKLAVLRAKDPSELTPLEAHEISDPTVVLMQECMRAIESGFWETALINQFWDVPTPTMEEKWPFLDKLERETLLRIIVGQTPLDGFGEFVDEWYAQGGKQITQEVNEWWEVNK